MLQVLSPGKVTGKVTGIIQRCQDISGSFSATWILKLNLKLHG